MLPKTAEYALRAVVALGRVPGEAVSADELAGRTKVPRRYLNRVLQDLARAGLVRSQSGPRGGHSLVRRPEETTILDVVNAVGEVERIRECPLGLPSHVALCPLHAELDRAYAAAEAAFAAVTIARLIDSSGHVPPLCDGPA